MKLGIILGTTDAETVWNAFRLANTCVNAEGHAVKVFLINKGVQALDADDEQFDVKKQAADYTASGGKILACGTCLKRRGKQATKTCPMSNMQELLELIEESDKLITFG